jgi:hypothetical protein
MKKLVGLAVTALTLGALAGEMTVEVGGLTPEQALEKIRAAKAAGNKEAWTINVKKGYHTLSKTLVFTPEDSGSPKAPVIWKGEEGAVIGGGAEIKGWKDEGNGVWSAPAPLNPDGTPIWMEEMWVNCRRAQRARFPNKGYLKIASANQVESQTKGVYAETAVFTNSEIDILGTIPAEELKYVQMLIRHKWSFAKRVIHNFDAAKKEVSSSSKRFWGQTWVRWSKDSNFFFENIRTAFDAPGEWFYDMKNKKISYRPLAGEKIDSVKFFMPLSKISKLVEMKGSPDEDKWVSDINFSNIDFVHTDVEVSGKNAKPSEVTQLQAASTSDGAFTLEGIRRIKWDGCNVKHTGNYAFRFNDGCTSNKISNCTLDDLGAGGIWMGAKKGYVAKGEVLSRRIIKNLAPRSTAFNTIIDCTIKNGGRVNPEGTGVAITHASDCKVLHCDIHDFWYTGVSVGWTWGFMGSVAQRNEIAYNKIYNLGKYEMCDMGGVYTLGTSFGTKVHHNVIHDVYSYKYGGWGLYTDEGSEGIEMSYNLVYNTHDGGFHQHYGTDNIIKNNIFVWNQLQGSIRSQRKIVKDVVCSFHLINNIIVTKESKLSSDGAAGVRGIWAGNLWYVPQGATAIWGKDMDWEAFKKSGREVCGMFADPQFEDIEKGDYRLKTTSPAFGLGFKSFDISEAGRRTEK